MGAVRHTIEKWFEKIGAWTFDNRIKAILLTILVTLPMVAQLPKTTIDTTNESFFHEEDQTLIDYNHFRDQFGKDELFIIALNPPQVFDFRFLEKLKALHQELEDNVPYLSDITSLINARNTRGDEKSLIVEDLMADWPRTEPQLAELKTRVLSNPVYLNTLISEDATFTTITLKAQTHVSVKGTEALEGFENTDILLPNGESLKKQYLSNEQNREIVEAVTVILKKYEAPDFPIHLAGLPVVVDSLDRSIRKDMERLTPLSLLLIVICLFIMFRRISGVVYPVLVVVLSLLSTLGLMAATGIPITNITQILPSFLIVVGVGDSVHILALFYYMYRKTGDKKGSVVYALGHSGLAVLLTSITTAVGLLSFVVADVAPIADLGLVAPIGVTLALFYSVILLPALLSLFPVIKPKVKNVAQTPLVDRILSRIARLSCNHPGKILTASLLLLAFALLGLPNLKISHNGLKWLPESFAVRQATDLLDAKLRGTVSLEIIIDTGAPNGLHDPQLLNRLEKAVTDLEGLEEGDAFVGKAWTLTTILKEINRALHENRQEFYAVPQDRDLVAQEFLLFENSGSDDLEEVVDSQFRTARFSLKSPFTDAVKYKHLIGKINAYFAENLPGVGIKTTGIMTLFAQMINNVVSSMVKSYIIAVTVITILMIGLIGRVRIGMLSMVPNLAPILAILGLMGWMRIPLDLATILVGSITLGLVVDDTIHFMSNFRRYFEKTGDPEEAVSLTLQTTGRAMFVTSVVLAGGFFINMLAEIKSTYNYGLLAGSSVILALLADFFLAPALMILANRRRVRLPEGAAGLAGQEGAK